ncbi:putative high affinity copper transporter, partial [Operophtera brumata]
ETSTPPLLESPINSESDFFICQTRTCIQPSHYFRASTSQDSTDNATCYYGAKKCPSKVARAKKTECHHTNEKEDSPSVDVQLLRTERQGCCKKKPEPPPEECLEEISAVVHEPKCCKEEREEREQSPQITCCSILSRN